MNWSRGQLRAWMVFTAVWFIGIGAATYNQWPVKLFGVNDDIIVPSYQTAQPPCPHRDMFSCRSPIKIRLRHLLEKSP